MRSGWRPTIKKHIYKHGVFVRALRSILFLARPSGKRSFRRSHTPRSIKCRESEEPWQVAMAEAWTGMKKGFVQRVVLRKSISSD